MESKPQEYPSDEIALRAEAALRRALNTPPQPKHGKVKESNAGRAATDVKAAVEVETNRK
jgi:hypothetical protein